MSNVDHRTQQTRDSLERLYRLDKEIDALIEEHVAPLRQDKRDIKKKMRDDFDVPTKRLNARYALYKEERQAFDNQDATALDAIRYLFNAAPVGTQTDWIAAIKEPQAAAGDEEEDDKDLRPGFLKDKDETSDS